MKMNLAKYLIVIGTALQIIYLGIGFYIIVGHYQRGQDFPYSPYQFGGISILAAFCGLIGLILLPILKGKEENMLGEPYFYLAIFAIFGSILM